MQKNILTKSKYASIFLIILTLISIFITFYCIPKIPQWLSYHQFADAKTFWKIPSFANVVSNITFCIVGIIGFITLNHQVKQATLTHKEIIIFLVLFTGIFLIGLGSSYYHWNPTNDTLVWDRIPITIFFMSLLSFTIMERVNLNLGFWLLIPLIAFGIFSVLYWHWTETIGQGDLRLYGLVQFYSMILIVAILYYFPKPYPPTSAYLWMFIFYGLAKICEKLDVTIYAMNGYMSGHTLKHILAAISTYWIIKILIAKRDKPSN